VDVRDKMHLVTHEVELHPFSSLSASFPHLGGDQNLKKDIDSFLKLRLVAVDVRGEMKFNGYKVKTS